MQQATEIARLKRQLADKDEEVEILKKLQRISLILPTNVATDTHRICRCCYHASNLKRYSFTCLHDSIELVLGLAANTYQRQSIRHLRPNSTTRENDKGTVKKKRRKNMNQRLRESIQFYAGMTVATLSSTAMIFLIFQAVLGS